MSDRVGDFFELVKACCDNISDDKETNIERTGMFNRPLDDPACQQIFGGLCSRQVRGGNPDACTADYIGRIVNAEKNSSQAEEKGISQAKDACRSRNAHEADTKRGEYRGMTARKGIGRPPVQRRIRQVEAVRHLKVALRIEHRPWSKPYPGLCVAKKTKNERDEGEGDNG